MIKRILLILVMSTSCMFSSFGQDAPIDLFRAGTNRFGSIYNSAGFTTTASTTANTPYAGTTPYEGTTHFLFDYNNTGSGNDGARSIATGFNDFSKHTHLVVAYMGVGGTTGNTLQIGFSDGTNFATKIDVATNNGGVYKVDTIPLSLFMTGSASLSLSNITRIDYRIGGTTGFAGQFYLDNIQVIDLENVKGGAINNISNIPLYDSYVFSSTAVGSSATTSFTIENYGAQNLVLNGTPKIAISGTNASEFTIDQTSLVSSLATGTSTTFTITFTPTTSGTKTAKITISNKYGTYSGNGSYVINLTNNPVSTNIDLFRAGTNRFGSIYNSAGFTTTASTTANTPYAGTTPYEGTTHFLYDYNNTGTGNDGARSIASGYNNFSNYTHIVVAYMGVGGTTGNTLQWGFSDGTNYATKINVASNNGGVYKVDTIPLSLFMTGNANLSLSKINRIDYRIGGTTGFAGQFYLDNIVVIDLVNVREEATNIAPFGTYNFGSSNTGIPTAATTFTIENYGVQDLALGTITKSGTNASDFTITQASPTSIAGSGSATFTVIFNPSSAGAKTAAITIPNKYGTYATNGSYVINLTGTGTVPEVNVREAATSIASGGSFDFGSSDVSIATAATTFTIENSGTGTLTLSGTPRIAISGAQASDFSIDSTLLSAPIAAGGTTTFKISFNPSAAGSRTAAITISNNDSDEGTYVINLLGMGTVPAVSEIDLKEGGSSIASGGTYDFGSQVSGSSGSPITFTIENLGTTALELSGAPRIAISGADALDFNIDSTSLSAPIGVSNSTSFTIIFNPSAIGSRTAAISISNDDSDEGTYIINLAGTGTATPEPEINVKRGSSNIASGGSFDFGSSNIGTATSASSFTIENLGAAVLTLTGTPRVAISGTHALDFSIDSTSLSGPIAASGTTSFSISFNPLATGSRTAMITISNDDSDESTYVINLTGTGTAPEINVKEGANSVPSGGSVSFGSSNVGTAIAATTFTIENLGAAVLTLTGTPRVAISGTQALDFSIDSTSLSGPIAASGTTSFTISFNPLATGSRTAMITISNDDSDESTYVINLTGTGTAPEINVKEGANSVVSGGSVSFGSSNVGTATAATIFTVENLGAAVLTLTGIPRIAISGTHALDFSIDSTSLSGPIAASGTTSFSISFNPLATGSRTAAITISNDDSDESTYVINLTGTGTAPEINVKEGANSVVSGGSVSFGSSNVGTATAATTFTIENLGTAVLTLTGTPRVAISGTQALDFSIDSTSLSGPIAASGTTSFSISFNPLATGSRTAMITISNDDSDESVYVINLTGTGTAPEINVKEGLTNSSIASGGSFNFGDSNVGTASAAITFTIENSGTALLALSGTPRIAISGADAVDFTIDSTSLNAPIAGSANTTFTVTFNPSDFGPRLATIIISNNDSDEGAYVIDLTGHGGPSAGIAGSAGSDSYEVYPSPFIHEAKIKINSSLNAAITMKILDAKGTLVYTSNEFTNHDINLGKELERGIYFVQVSYQDRIQVIKIVKI
jgi:hypothetical protein